MGSRRAVAAGCAAVSVAGLLSACGAAHTAVLPVCTTGGLSITVEQAENATTIAAVGKRLGLPDHAVTVALATALQESGLRNLTYGDRDSLGLFQQRPSQGWGSRATVSTPRLAAASFFTHLQRIRGWQRLDVTDAAQRVQRSAAPDAYAQWERQARLLARALTGEVPAGLACRYPRPSGRVGDPRALAVAELGEGGVARSGSVSRTWTAASWLVAHASSYGVTRVSVAGRTWTRGTGRWGPDPAAAALSYS